MLELEELLPRAKILGSEFSRIQANTNAWTDDFLDCLYLVKEGPHKTRFDVVFRRVYTLV